MHFGAWTFIVIYMIVRLYARAAPRPVNSRCLSEARRAVQGAPRCSRYILCARDRAAEQRRQRLQQQQQQQLASALCFDLPFFLRGSDMERKGYTRDPLDDYALPEQTVDKVTTASRCMWGYGACGVWCVGGDMVP